MHRNDENKTLAKRALTAMTNGAPQITKNLNVAFVKGGEVLSRATGTLGFVAGKIVGAVIGRIIGAIAGIFVGQENGAKIARVIENWTALAFSVFTRLPVLIAAQGLRLALAVATAAVAVVAIGIAVAAGVAMLPFAIVAGIIYGIYKTIAKIDNYRMNKFADPYKKQIAENEKLLNKHRREKAELQAKVQETEKQSEAKKKALISDLTEDPKPEDDLFGEDAPAKEVNSQVAKDLGLVADSPKSDLEEVNQDWDELMTADRKEGDSKEAAVDVEKAKTGAGAVINGLGAQHEGNQFDIGFDNLSF